MARLTLDAFEAEVTRVCAESPIVTGLSTVATGVTWVHLRAYLDDGSFVDAFYNEATGKTAYALISSGRRIFGADNSRGWHWHPFESPESHLPNPEAVSFRQFIARVEEQLKG